MACPLPIIAKAKKKIKYQYIIKNFKPIEAQK